MASRDETFTHAMRIQVAGVRLCLRHHGWRSGSQAQGVGTGGRQVQDRLGCDPPPRPIDLLARTTALFLR